MRYHILNIIIKELFYILSIALIIFFAMELVFKGMVSSYFNLNFLLLLWLVNGIILLIGFNKDNI